MQSPLDNIPIPQDPFLPQSLLTGPSFLDTQACLCKLRGVSLVSNSVAAWQCVGQQLNNVAGLEGKWFLPMRDGIQSDTTKAVYDNSNPPNLQKSFLFDPSDNKLVLSSSLKGNLSVYDQACTGINQTTFTTTLYNSVNAISNKQIAQDAIPCYQPNALPIQIQTAESWQSVGCLSGFYCPNNTINSLPQFCPPVERCQEFRLAGGTCFYPPTSRNIGMGPFEPVICDQGFYCPPGGQDRLPCPKGSYCQPGASAPTPCSLGSYCPSGSYYQMFIVPMVILFLIDVLLGIGVFIRYLQKRKRRSKRPAAPYNPGPVTNIRRRMTRYNTLSLVSNMSLPDTAHITQPIVSHSSRLKGFQTILTNNHHLSSDLDYEAYQMSDCLRQFVGSMRKAANVANLGLSLDFEGLTYQPQGCPNAILSDITGSIREGSLTAVMGGSGAGKSTFVHVLMGKIMNTGGKVMINGTQDSIRRYKKIIGYVSQDDVVVPELTVYENIIHSARVRLPRTWTDQEIRAHADAVIDCLELWHVRDSRVGTAGKPTISGGQRKRVSIGMELAAAPMALFLDEPTSGLDATSASSLMQTLKAVAKIGITVVVIIHQPRVEIFEMIDNLILLANGRLIFEGPSINVQPFFESMEFEFPPNANFGDIITDIITGNGRPYKRQGDVSKDALIRWWLENRPSQNRSYGYSEKHASLSSPQDIKVMLKNRGAPRIKQFYFCLSRAMQQQYRLKTNFWFEMGLALLAGFLIGLAQNGNHGVNFVGIYNEPYQILSSATNYHNVPELALLTAIGIGLIAGSPGVRVFSEENLLQRREAEAGHSQIAYFLAKTVSAFPRMLFGCMHFTIPLLFLSSIIAPFQIAFAANFLYFYCIYGLASMVSMIAKREDAPLYATMLSLVVGILSGVAPVLRQVSDWHLAWLWRASPGTWIAELYFGQLIEPWRRIYQVDQIAGFTGYHLDWLATDFVVLLAIGTIYRVVAFGGLYFGKRLRI